MKKLQAGAGNAAKLVQEFATQFPRFETKSGAKGVCKFVSWELARFLRDRGTDAVLYHLQGCDKTVYPKAHKDWLDKPGKDWSHYVVRIEGEFYDLSARQFDPALEYPKVFSLEELKATWKVVEKDKFLNRLLVNFQLSTR